MLCKGTALLRRLYYDPNGAYVVFEQSAEIYLVLETGAQAVWLSGFVTRR